MNEQSKKEYYVATRRHTESGWILEDTIWPEHNDAKDVAEYLFATGTYFQACCLVSINGGFPTAYYTLEQR